MLWEVKPGHVDVHVEEGRLAYAHSVQQEVGAIDREGVINADGEMVPYSELDEQQAQLVRDLTMVQYDFSVGKRYALDEMWYSPTQQHDER